MAKVMQANAPQLSATKGRVEPRPEQDAVVERASSIVRENQVVLSLRAA